MGLLTEVSKGNHELDTEWAFCDHFRHTVIEPFARRLESEKDYYFHTTALIGLPYGYDLENLDIPSPKRVVDCRSAKSVTEAFNELKEDTHYIVLDDIYSLPKDNDLPQWLYLRVKESVFRADRLIILYVRNSPAFILMKNARAARISSTATFFTQQI